jgi:hypothetical protein
LANYGIRNSAILKFLNYVIFHFQCLTRLSGDVKLKAKKKESVRDQLSLASNTVFNPSPIKVAVDTILNKSIVP